MTDMYELAQRMRETADKWDEVVRMRSNGEFVQHGHRAELHNAWQDLTSTKNVLFLLDALSQRDAQITRLTTERDALREEKIGKNSNTRDAADIYFQLVEECEIPPGGSLVQYVNGLKEQIAELKADFISLDKQMSVLEQTGIADRDRAQKAEAQLAELAKQEPIYQFIMNRPDIDGYIEWVDCNKNYFNSCGDDIRRIVYAAPPAPVTLPRVNHPAQFDYADKVAEILKANGLKVVGHEDE